MKCLIIAAGQGSRLRQKAECKPLVPLHGVPLIERVIEAARLGGASEFCVVSGYQGERLRAHLDIMAARDNINIQHVENDRWCEPNGISVLAAQAVLRDPFLLMMSDHLFDPNIVRGVVQMPLADDEVILAVDARLDNQFVDMDDVTRVYQEKGLVRAIGKHLEPFNAFDTGIFRCTPGLFGALELSIAQDQDASLSGGIRLLSKTDRVKTYDVGDRFWLDVDDSRTYVKAEVALSEMTQPNEAIAGPHVIASIAKQTSL